MGAEACAASFPRDMQVSGYANPEVPPALTPGGGRPVALGRPEAQCQSLHSSIQSAVRLHNP